MKKKAKRITLLVGALTAVVICVLVVWSWEQIRFRILFESIGRNEQGLPEYRHRQTGIVMVRVPDGTFMMGSPEDEVGSEEDEHPQHEVTLSPFLIAKFEVTQAQWVAATGSNPLYFTGDDNLPVSNVSWDEIQEFERLTGLVLPTEAQWEYACRAGQPGPYSGTGNLADMGWYDAYPHRSGERGPAQPVGEKASNQFGLYDMHGNVDEWCEDVYAAAFYSNADATALDPLSIAGSEDRVIRGGSWNVSAPYCRSAVRASNFPSDGLSTIGFRAAYWPLP